MRYFSHPNPIRESVRALEPFWHSSLFLSLQSGLGNAEAVADKADRVLAGITNNVVRFVAPGEIEHVRGGSTVFGPWKGTSRDDAKALAATIEDSGLRAMVTVDGLGTALWDNAVINACIGPITALLGVGSGAVVRSQETMRCAELVLDEALGVAHARGVELGRADALERVRTASRAARDKPSSLLQDLARGRRTEIDALNGRIAALGEEMGIACPVNRALTLLVKAAESVRGAALASSRRMDSPSLALYDARAGEEALSRT